MARINLKKLMTRHGLTKKELANVLFPMNTYPVHALDRVLSGDTFLDANQISLLAVRLGVAEGELFRTDWASSVKGRVHTFTDGEYDATLDLDTMTLKFYVKGTLKHDTILASPAITVSELITLLNNLK